MGDSISRMTKEEAIQWLIRPTVSSTEIGEFKAKELKAYEMAIEALSEPKTGKWIRDRWYWPRGTGMGEEYRFFYKCSLCKCEVEDGYHTKCSFNFCPYCGADMRDKE